MENDLFAKRQSFSVNLGQLQLLLGEWILCSFLASARFMLLIRIVAHSHWFTGMRLISSVR